MDREILFRGKRIDSGEWVEGNLILSNDVDPEYKTLIIPNTDANMYETNQGDIGFEKWHKVDKNTVCQYTGFNDKNKNKIFEGDIIAFEDATSTESGFWERNCTGKVLWDSETSSFQVTDRLSCESYEAMDRNCNVVGNIFDNPEIMGGE